MSETKVVYVPSGTEQVVGYRCELQKYSLYATTYTTIKEFYTDDAVLAASYISKVGKAEDGDYGDPTWRVTLVHVWRDSNGNLFPANPIKKLPTHSSG